MGGVLGLGVSGLGLRVEGLGLLGLRAFRALGFWGFKFEVLGFRASDLYRVTEDWASFSSGPLRPSAETWKLFQFRVFVGLLGFRGTPNPKTLNPKP